MGAVGADNVLVCVCVCVCVCNVCVWRSREAKSCGGSKLLGRKVQLTHSASAITLSVF